jgi:hypothetical protein
MSVVEAMADLERSSFQRPDRLISLTTTATPSDERGSPAEVWQPAVAAVSARRAPGFHDLRHYYASRCSAGTAIGEDRPTTALGPATAAGTLDSLRTPLPDSGERTGKAIDSSCARRATSTPRPSGAAEPAEVRGRRTTYRSLPASAPRLDAVSITERD